MRGGRLQIHDDRIPSDVKMIGKKQAWDAVLSTCCGAWSCGSVYQNTDLGSRQIRCICSLAGLNFWAGKGLVSYDGGFLKLWPPLYPVLSAWFAVLTESRDADSRQRAAGRLFSGSRSASHSVSEDLRRTSGWPSPRPCCHRGAVVLVSFNTAGSDYLQLFLVVLLHSADGALRRIRLAGAPLLDWLQCGCWRH